MLSLLTAIATIISIAVVLRSRQLSRPKLRLHFGSIGLERGRGDLPNRRPRRLIVYGVPSVSRDYLIVPVAIGLENLSPLPISALHLQLEYPAECLLEDSTVQEDEGGRIKVGGVATKGRDARRFGSVAHVTYDIDVVRSREKAVISEVLRIPRHRVPSVADDRSQAVLHRRWGGSEGFLSAFQIRIYASASNADPIDVAGVAAAVLARDEDDLTRRADALLAKSWEGRRFTSAPVRRFWRRPRPRKEFAELVFLTRDALIAGPSAEVDPTVLRSSRTALLEFNMPPWGFAGEVAEADATPVGEAREG